MLEKSLALAGLALSNRSLYKSIEKLTAFFLLVFLSFFAQSVMADDYYLKSGCSLILAAGSSACWLKDPDVAPHEPSNIHPGTPGEGDSAYIENVEVPLLWVNDRMILANMYVDRSDVTIKFSFGGPSSRPYADLTGDLTVGYNYGGAQLTVKDNYTNPYSWDDPYYTGSKAVIRSTNNIYVGQNADYNTLTLMGMDWEVSNDIKVGVHGSYNEMLMTTSSGDSAYRDNTFSIIENASSLDIGYGSDSLQNRVVVENGSLLTLTENIRIGQSGSDNNALRIFSGGKVNAAGVYLGLSGGNNHVVVSGNNSQLNASDTFLVGVNGSGNLLQITDNAIVTTGYLNKIGAGSGDHNSVGVLNGGLWTMTGDLSIGSGSGTGSGLAISTGGEVINDNASISSFGSGRSHKVIVTDVDSKWTSNGSVYVGGDDTSAVGSATVDINNSAEMHVAGLLKIWNDGLVQNFTGVIQTNTLMVEGGEIQTVNFTVDDVPMVNGLTSVSSSANITGTGAKLTVVDALKVGDIGSSKSLIVANGAKATAATVQIGQQEGADNNTFTVGADSDSKAASLTLTDNISIGNRGSGNRLEIAGGATVSNQKAWISRNTTASNNTVEVSGTNSRWDSSDDLVVGNTAGGSATLLVRDTSAVTAGGELKLRSGGDVTLADQAAITVGSLTNNGGTISAGDVLIDAAATETTGTFVVNGNASLSNGAQWNNSGSLRMGFSAGNAQLTIDGGSSVVSNGASIGQYATSNSQLTVTGSGSDFTSTADINLGQHGSSSNQLNISEGASVTANTFYIGRQTDGDNNTVTLGSTIEDASLTLNNSLYIGGTSGVKGGDNNAATVNTGGTLNVAGTIKVWDGNTLNLDGGSITTTNLEVAETDLNFTSGSLIIDGGNVNGGTLAELAIEGDSASNSANWSFQNGAIQAVTGNVSVGKNNNGSLNITGASQLTSTLGFIGRQAGSDNNVVNVNDVNSSWTMSGALKVGDAGSSNSLLINEGSVTNNHGYIGAQAGANSNSVEVTGLNASWTNNAGLYVGDAGSNNTLTINGASVAANNVYISRSSGSDANKITVGYRGSLQANNNIYVGGDNVTSSGGIATFKVKDGGTVDVGNRIKIWDKGIATINGTVNAQRIDLLGGTLTGSGVIKADLYNTDGGNINAGNSPGLLTIIGDYTQDEFSTFTFELAGVTPESEYDVVDISGTADLAGELELLWYDGFEADLGDSFDLLFAELILGEFDWLTLAVLGEGLAWDIEYLTDEIGLTDVLRATVVSSVPVPAAAWLFGSALIGLVGIKRKK